MKTYYLKIRMLLACFIVLIFSTACSSDDSSGETEKATTSQDLNVETQIFQLVNKHRASIGKNELAINDLANSLAKEHSTYMIEQGKLSHDNSDLRGKRLIDEESANKIGENVAFKYKDADEVMQVWLDSPSHKKNIENDFTHIGISALKDNDGIFYYTQVFFRK